MYSNSHTAKPRLEQLLVLSANSLQTTGVVILGRLDALIEPGVNCDLEAYVGKSSENGFLGSRIVWEDVEPRCRNIGITIDSSSISQNELLKSHFLTISPTYPSRRSSKTS
ncbi:hypothetical protein SUGI_0573450 [Cryptomeria japonica]|nr:hypothetical protein SUGI_0573450 [Cryptomeria japonica]